MKKKKLIPCIITIVAIVLLGIAGVKLYQLMFGGAVKVQTADIISAIAQMKLQLIIGQTSQTMQRLRWKKKQR